MQNGNDTTVAEKYCASVFVTSMAMIFIFGFTKKYLLDGKLDQFEDRPTKKIGGRKKKSELFFIDKNNASIHLPDRGVQI